MAHVPGFKHDVFISYAIVDNDETAWVSHFEAGLHDRLVRKVGKNVSIWRDREIGENQTFSDTIAEALDGTAVFLSLTSPNCLFESKYCEQERKHFYQKAQKEAFGLKVNKQFRLVNVRLYDIPHERWPEEYGRRDDSSAGFVFFERDKGDPHDELGKPLQPGDERYEKMLDRLANALRSMLLNMKMAAESAQAAADQPLAPNAFTVFLANATDNHLSAKNLALDRLLKEGVRLFEAPPPYDFAGHEEKVAEYLKSADVAVHLFDRVPGRNFDDARDKFYTMEQFRLSREHAKTQMLWLTREPDLEKNPDEIEDADYRAWLRTALNERPPDKHVEVCKSLPSELPQLILDMKDAWEKERAALKSTDAAQTLLVDCHNHDEEVAFKLANKLRSEQIDHKIFTGSDREPHEKRRYYLDLLHDAAKLIIFFGGAGVDWVLGRLELVYKFSTENKLPLQACGIYVAPPQKRVAEFDNLIRFREKRATDWTLRLLETPEELLDMARGKEGER